MISARIAQLNVNKLFKQTKKKDLKPILSLSFDGKNRFVEYSVVLSTKLDKEINILALILKIIRSFCFLRKEPREISTNHRLTFETSIRLNIDISKASKSI